MQFLLKSIIYIEKNVKFATKLSSLKSVKYWSCCALYKRRLELFQQRICIDSLSENEARKTAKQIRNIYRRRQQSAKDVDIY